MSQNKGGKVRIPGTPLSQSVMFAGLVAIVLAILGVAIYLPADNQFDQRLGIVMLVAAAVVPALVAAVRGDKGTTVSEATKLDTQRMLNGELETKINATVHQALIDHDQSVHGLPHPSGPLPAPGNQHAPRAFHPRNKGDTHP